MSIIDIIGLTTLELGDAPHMVLFFCNFSYLCYSNFGKSKASDFASRVHFQPFVENSDGTEDRLWKNGQFDQSCLCVFANLKVGRFLGGANRKGGHPLTEGPIMVQCPEKGPRAPKVLMLKTADWSFLRRLHLQDGKSLRWISREFGLSRKTVAKYVQEESPPKYKMSSPRKSPQLEPFKKVIDAILEADKTAPRKHKHTAKRIFDRLTTESGYTGCETTVRNYVAAKRAEQNARPLFIPMAYPPGEQGQVDFGEVFVCLNCPHAYLDLNLRNSVCAAREPGRQLSKLQCFVLRLSYSRRVFAMCFPSANMPSFIAAHRLAFEHFGSRPRVLVYDNLALAVRKVLKGHDRELTDMFLQLAGHYGFEHHFCKPGKEGAHEKGGVEEGIGYIRRNWLTPVLHVRDVEELNEYLLKRCQQDMARTVAEQPCTISEAWQMERNT